MYSPGDTSTVLAGTQQICQSLGDACNKYADAIDAKRSQVQDALIGAGIAVGITTIVGVLGTIFTGGGSDAAAGAADEAEVAAIVGDVATETATTVEADVSATIGSDLVATVEAAAEDVLLGRDRRGRDHRGSGRHRRLARQGDGRGRPEPGPAQRPEAATLTRLQDEFPERGFKRRPSDSSAPTIKDGTGDVATGADGTRREVL